MKALEEMKRVTKNKLTFTVTHKDIAKLEYPLPRVEREDCLLFTHEDGNMVAFSRENLEKILEKLDLKVEKLKVFTEQDVARTTQRNFGNYSYNHIENPHVKSKFLVIASK